MWYLLTCCCLYICMFVCLYLQDRFFGESNMSTYIGTVMAKPGSADPGTNFPKWKKGGVSEELESVLGVIVRVLITCILFLLRSVLLTDA